MKRTFLACALTTLYGLSAAPSAVAQTDAPGELRVYDVSTLQVAGAPVSHTRYSRLLPSTHYERPDGEVFEELEQATAFDLLADLIRSVYGEEFEYEGRRFDITDDGRLVVRGPAALHERVARLIGFFETAINSEARLRVDVVRLPREQGTPPPAAMITEAEAQTLVAAAQSGNRLNRHELTLRGDRDAVLDLSRSRPILFDYDVEIAQGAAIQDPIVYSMQDGTRITVRGAPGAGGIQLAVMLKRGDLIEGDEPRDLNAKAMISTEGGQPYYAAGTSIFPDVELANRSASFTTFLPAGKALALRTDLALSTRRYHDVVIFRHVGGALPSMLEIPLENSGSKVIVADLGAIAPPRVVAMGGLLREGQVPRSLDRYLNQEPLLDVAFLRGDLDFMADLVTGGSENLSVERIGRWLLTCPYGEYIGGESPQILADQERVKERFKSLQIAPRVLDMTITATRSGAPQAAIRLPVCAGTSASFALGIESFEISDFDVEVAQFAAVSDPTVRPLFDGMAVWAKPMITAQGELLIDVRGSVTLLVKKGRFDLGTRMLDFLENSTMSQLFVSERLKLSAGADGEWRTTMGDSGGNGLALEIVVKRL